ncbi:unnamed protein product [Cuscuta europaea]|uniref:tRNA dimethylallyltransferase n=1 Tax=Cuscuta europaea TaxID=41803 RepID=A0A9P1EI72_CUSEU|nr:unnamed protein product [Cuscuta europaea]
MLRESIRMSRLRSWYTAETHFIYPYDFRFRGRRHRLFATSCSVSTKVTTGRKEKVIVISGPTGAGKSKLAFDLAKRLNGEIISADSVQVYRGLDIGSAKPSLTERKEVPHHLVDILHPSEDYSVGRFFEDARQATKDVINKGHVPIVVGGTGLYLRWLVYGKPDVPKASREITSEVHTEIADLQRDDNWDVAVELVVKAGDPGVKSLAVNDWYRLRRRLEIIKSSGLSPSAFEVPYNSYKEQIDSGVADASDNSCLAVDGLQQIKAKDLDYDFLCFFLTTQRLDLYRAIDFRCEDMLLDENGILSEARWLLDLGLLPNSNSATRAIGYRQAMEYLLFCREQRGSSSSREFFAFLSEFQKASRNFAKRQLTWFRNEPLYHWIDASKPMEILLEFIYDSFHSEFGSLEVPQSLFMEKDMSSRREVAEMKAYRPKNKHFVGRDDCSPVLNWVQNAHKSAAATSACKF